LAGSITSECPQDMMRISRIPVCYFTTDYIYGTQFPEKYRGDLYIAFHGSWNRTKPTGYKVVRVILDQGIPVRIEDFISGWLLPTERRWGRPVEVEIAADGSMFISDDYEGVIYRVSYE